MIALAPHLGRERAHDTVYDLARKSRESRVPFSSVLTEWLRTQPHLPSINPAAHDNVGQARQCCDAAASQWHAALEAAPSPWKEDR